MKKIIGFIICMMFIATSGFSVLGINENRDTSIIKHSSAPTGLYEWPMFRYDLNNTGYSPSKAPDNDTLLWSKDIAYQLDSNPTIKDGKLYMACNTLKRGGEVYCLNPFTGEEIWKIVQFDDEIWGSPTVANDRVYVLGIYHYLYCYDANTGDTLWKYQADGHCSPMVFDNKVYFGSSYYEGFHCLNATTGEEIWTHDQTTHYSGCTPAIVNDKIYIASDEGILYCLDADSGAEFWWASDRGYWSSPAYYEDKIYIGYDKLYCLDADTGEDIWSVDLAVPFTHCSPAVAYGNVYIDGGYDYSEGDGKTYCYDADTGDWIWTSPLLGFNIWNDYAVADDKVYICSNNKVGELGKFNCLDAYTGDIIWQFEFIGRYSASSPAVAYGNVYVGSGDGYLYAFGIPNEPPETPIKPDGPFNGLVNVEYVFNSSSTDPEDDDIYYLFDWGDGNDSDWIGPYASGEKVSASHIWIDFGYYDIRVKAYDNRQESNWSDPLTIHITTLPPDAPSIDGPSSGKKGVSYDFTFNSIDPEGDYLYYYIKWGDGAEEEWNGPHHSGIYFEITHSFPFRKTFTIEAKAKDASGAESDWSYFDIEIPRTRTTTNNMWFQWFLERFPMLEKLLNLIRAG